MSARRPAPGTARLQAWALRVSGQGFGSVTSLQKAGRVSSLGTFARAMGILPVFFDDCCSTGLALPSPRLLQTATVASGYSPCPSWRGVSDGRPKVFPMRASQLLVLVPSLVVCCAGVGSGLAAAERDELVDRVVPSYGVRNDLPFRVPSRVEGQVADTRVYLAKVNAELLTRGVGPAELTTLAQRQADLDTFVAQLVPALSITERQQYDAVSADLAATTDSIASLSTVVPPAAPLSKSGAPAPVKGALPVAVPTPVEAPAVEIPAAVEAPVETPAAEVPAEVPMEVPMEVPAEVPAEVSAEAPAEAPAEVPAEVPVEAPAAVADPMAPAADLAPDLAPEPAPAPELAP